MGWMRRPRFLSVFLIVAILFSMTGGSAIANNQEIAVYVNGRQLELDTKPIMENDRVLVPMRSVFEALGATIIWDQQTRTVKAYYSGINLSLTIGENTATRNQQTLDLDVPAKIVNGRTMVPVRFVGEALGATVNWDGKSQTVTVIQTAEGVRSAYRASVGLKDFEVAAWYVQMSRWDTGAFEYLQKTYHHLDTIISVRYRIDKDGNLIEMVNTDNATELAKKDGTKSLALVKNLGTSGRFERDIITSILNSEEARKNAIDQIYVMVRDGGYAGVNIDFENIAPADRDNLTLFMKELSERLRPEGYEVSMAVPAKMWDDVNHGWSGAYDYKALANYVDQLMIMTYDQHWGTSRPGPVAGIDWVERAVKYAVSAVPPEKILLGVPGYGYSWEVGTTSGRAVAATAAISRLEAEGVPRLWDPVAKVPYFYYDNRVVYYEDAESIKYKVELAQSYNLGGIVLWRLGYEDPEIWPTIERMTKNPGF